MYKYLSMFCVVVFICIFFAGCGSAPVNSSSVTENQVPTGDAGSLPQPSTDQKDGDLTDSNHELGDDLPIAYIYTTEDHIIPMSESATIDGVTCQILDCVKTSEFGDRKLDNLNYFYDDNGIDDKGNLINGSYYFFITFQYTNTTDSEVEIYRGAKGIYSIDDRFIVRGYAISANYIDEYWTGGAPNEVYHYKLAPGESVTSEVGFIVTSEAEEWIKNNKLYFALRQADCLTDFGGTTDPEAVFVELEY